MPARGHEAGELNGKTAAAVMGARSAGLKAAGFVSFRGGDGGAYRHGGGGGAPAVRVGLLPKVQVASAGRPEQESAT